MKRNGVATGKSTDQRSKFVGVSPIECFVLHERQHALDTVRIWPDGLNGQPLIDHQRLVLPLPVEIFKHRCSFIRLFIMCNPAQSDQTIGQVICTLVEGVGGFQICGVGRQQVVLREMAKGPDAHVRGVSAVSFGRGMVCQGRPPGITQHCAQPCLHLMATLVELLDVNQSPL